MAISYQHFICSGLIEISSICVLFSNFCAVLIIFVLFYVFLCRSMYCLFCDVLFIVCVYMCIELLPPGIVYHIIYHISRHVTSCHAII
jgi:hypothetical protein